METEKYVGPRRVVMVSVEELKTYGGNDVVKVVYDGGYSEIMPKRTFEIVATTEPKDFNFVRDTKFAVLYKELYPIISAVVAVTGEDIEVKKAARLTMLQECLAAVSEIDLKDSEIKSFFDQMNVEFYSIPNAIMFELSNEFSRAINWVWTKDDSQFVPGMDVMNDRTYLEAKKIVSTIPKKDAPESGQSTTQ